MPTNDDLKNRLDELFSSPVAKPADSTAVPEAVKVTLEDGPSTGVFKREQVFSSAFANAAIGMVLTSPDGRLLKVNEAFGELLGYSSQELEGTSFQRLTYSEDVAIGAEAMRSMLSDLSDTAHIQKRFVHKLGDLVWVDLSITLIRDRDSKPLYFMTIAQDITSQKEIDSLLELRLGELNLMDEIGKKIEERPSIESLLAWTVERLAAHLPLPGVYEMAIEYKGQIFGSKNAMSLPSHSVAELRIADTRVGQIYLAAVIHDGFSEGDSDLIQRVASRLSGYLETQSALDEVGSSRRFLENLINSLHDPVFVKDEQHRWVVANRTFEQILGLPQEKFLGKSDYDLLPKEQADVFWEKDDLVFRTEETNINEEVILWGGEMRSISTVKSVFKDPGTGEKFIVGAIRDITERKRSEELANKRAAQLAQVAALSTAVAETLKPDELLQRVVNLTKDSFHLYHAHIYLLDESGETLKLAAGAFEVGEIMVKQGWQISIDQQQSLVARAARERTGVIVNDVREDPGFLPNELLPDTRSEMAVPLTVGIHLLGVLDVQADSPGIFTQEDDNIMTTLGYQVAVALQNAQQYQRVQDALATTEVLYNGSSQMAAASTASEVLGALIDSTVLKDFDYTNILIFDIPWVDEMPSHGSVVASFDRLRINQVTDVGFTFDLADPRLMQLFEKDKPALINDLSSDNPARPLLLPFYSGVGRSFASFPLWVGRTCIGVVLAISTEQISLEVEEQRRIASLVDQAAAVLESQRLQKDMQARLHELTALQRYMSREAWATYQIQMEGEVVGYLLDRGQLLPVTQELVPVLGNGHEPKDGAPSATDTPVFSTTLSVRGEPIGLFGISQENGQSLSEEDEQFLEAISEQVAQALERARLMEQTQRSAVELQAVAEVSTATSTILEPTSLLQKVVDLTKERFGLYHTHIYLLDDDKQNLVLAAGAGAVGKHMMLDTWSIPIERDDSIVARTARTQQGQIVLDVQKEPRFLQNPLLPETRSELAVPIVVGEELLGVFDVQANTVGRFTIDDVRTYSTLASQIGVALQNAKMYTEQLITVERLRELDNMKSAFLANMSHELRTPLNSILGFAQVILEGLDGPLTELMTSDLELIEKNGKHLLHLINDVLDLARIEAGRLTLSPESTDLYSLLDEVIMTTAPLVGEKDLELKLVADSNIDWTVMLDQVRMRQIFINLIGNAIKFTENGGVYVEMDKIWSPEAGLEDRLQVRIRDTGIGIQPEKLEEIFEAFSQVDNSTTRKAGGTGLGLPISRRLVEMHGGKLWAESPGLGMGTTLFLELPIVLEQDANED